MKKIHSNIIFCGGSNTPENGICLSDDVFLEFIVDQDNEKLPRLSSHQVRELLYKSKNLSKEQKLLKSVIEDIELRRAISEMNFKNLQDIYEFRRKYKFYIKCKCIIPLSIVAPFTGTELSKLAYASALGAKSVSLTVPGLIGYLLPAYFFFHMSSFYVPDKVKPICEFCKYSLGAPIWIASCFTDELTSDVEQKIFGEEVPLDLLGTGGTIPADVGDITKLREILEDMKEFGKDIGKKTY